MGASVREGEGEWVGEGEGGREEEEGEGAVADTGTEERGELESGYVKGNG